MHKERVRHGIQLGLLLLLAVVLAYGTALERQQQRLSGALIRLHVVANSDSEADQAVKRQVRDAVLQEAEVLLMDVDSQTQAKATLRENLAALETAANETLAALGVSDRAQVTLERELFGTRTYDTFALPGGYYDALRVRIGAGEGKNWWCVVYPQLCTATSTEDQRAVAVMGGLTGDQVALMEGDTPEYQLKFRLLELLEDLLGWARTAGEGIPVSG